MATYKSLNRYEMGSVGHSINGRLSAADIIEASKNAYVKTRELKEHKIDLNAPRLFQGDCSDEELDELYYNYSFNPIPSSIAMFGQRKIIPYHNRSSKMVDVSIIDGYRKAPPVPPRRGKVVSDCLQKQACCASFGCPDRPSRDATTSPMFSHPKQPATKLPRPLPRTSPMANPCKARAVVAVARPVPLPRKSVQVHATASIMTQSCHPGENAGNAASNEAMWRSVMCESSALDEMQPATKSDGNEVNFAQLLDSINKLRVAAASATSSDSNAQCSTTSAPTPIITSSYPSYVIPNDRPITTTTTFPATLPRRSIIPGRSHRGEAMSNREEDGSGRVRLDINSAPPTLKLPSIISITSSADSGNASSEETWPRECVLPAREENRKLGIELDNFSARIQRWEGRRQLRRKRNSPEAQQQHEAIEASVKFTAERRSRAAKASCVLAYDAGNCSGGVEDERDDGGSSIGSRRCSTIASHRPANAITQIERNARVVQWFHANLNPE